MRLALNPLHLWDDAVLKHRVEPFRVPNDTGLVNVLWIKLLLDGLLALILVPFALFQKGLFFLLFSLQNRFFSLVAPLHAALT